MSTTAQDDQEVVITNKNKTTDNQVSTTQKDDGSHRSVTSSERKRRDERKKENIRKQAMLQKERLRMEADEKAYRAEIERKKKEIEIDMKLLKLEDDMSDEDGVSVTLDIPIEDKNERTSNYVASLPRSGDHDDIASTHADGPTTSPVYRPPSTPNNINDGANNPFSDLLCFLMRKQLVPERFTLTKI